MAVEDAATLVSTLIELGAEILADGLYVTPIVYPAVPQNAPRLRCSLTAALSHADLDLAVAVLVKHREWLREV